jgi:ATP-dependent DNA helicase RecG
MIIEFIRKHTLDRFFLVDNHRVSVRSWIARELVSNILVHREYSKGFPARVIIERDRIYAENWNRSNRFGRIDPNNFTPEAKNPTLAWFFVNIGRADWMGSGIRNLYKYTKIYSGGEPELIEGDVFKTILPLKGIGPIGFNGTGNDVIITNGIPNHITNSITNGITNSITNHATFNETQRRILALIAKNPRVTAKLLSSDLGIAERNVKSHIKILKDSGQLVRVGGTRGYWEFAVSGS